MSERLTVGPWKHWLEVDFVASDPGPADRPRRRDVRGRVVATG